MSFRAVLERYRVNPRCSKKELAIASASSIQFSISVVGASGPVRFAYANCRRYVESHTSIAILSTTTRPRPS